METTVNDVAILGAGVAGVMAAHVLARRGMSVTLIDQSEVHRPVYRAEKIEADQADLLRALGLMDVVLPECRRINKIVCGHNGRVWRILDVEEYGCFYHDIVNRLRRELPSKATLKVGKAVSAQTSVSQQEVTLEDGQVVKARLLVVASGGMGKLQERLGFRREVFSSPHSLCLGFNVQPCEFPGGAESVTYRETAPESAIDYITLFPIKDLTRVNLFTFWEATDPRVRDMRDNATAAIPRYLSELSQVTGQLTVSSTVEAVPIHLYRLSMVERPGVVALGDAYQSVCPTTGTGLTKCLVDVQTLVKCVPGWFATPDLAAEKIVQFYSDAMKKATDADSLSDAFERKRLCLDRSFPWTIRRLRKYLPRQWAARRMKVAA